jgi:hypothetical protein
VTLCFSYGRRTLVVWLFIARIGNCYSTILQESATTVPRETPGQPSFAGAGLVVISEAAAAVSWDGSVLQRRSLPRAFIRWSTAGSCRRVVSKCTTAGGDTETHRQQQRHYRRMRVPRARATTSAAHIWVAGPILCVICHQPPVRLCDRPEQSPMSALPAQVEDALLAWGRGRERSERPQAPLDGVRKVLTAQ